MPVTSPTPRRRLTLAQARRLTLHAQGFTGRDTARVDRGHLRRLVERLGVLQIDSVNALARSHYLPLQARLGDYSSARLDEMAWSANRHRTLFEYWGHEASLMPLSLYPAMRWRMQRAREGHGIYKHLARFGESHRDLIRQVLGHVEREGAVRAGAIDTRDGPAGQWWDWSEEKTALEWLFAAGEVTVARRVGFERYYELPERVLPRTVIEAPTPSPQEAHRTLLTRAASALGVATERDLRDYYRLTPQVTRDALATLIEDETLTPISVEGWGDTAYLAGNPRVPRRVAADALLSPFDSLIWYRERTERLFGFRYRLEFYIPSHKRVYGYYVMPFLHHERLIARLDLRARRREGALAVLAIHPEPDVIVDDTAVAALAETLDRLAAWLGLAVRLDDASRLGARLASALPNRPPARD